MNAASAPARGHRNGTKKINDVRVVRSSMNEHLGGISIVYRTAGLTARANWVRRRWWMSVTVVCGIRARLRKLELLSAHIFKAGRRSGDDEDLERVLINCIV